MFVQEMVMVQYIFFKPCKNRQAQMIVIIE